MAKGLQEKTGSNSSTFGFNGKEMDNDMGSGTGNVYDYGFRIYNPRIAKFLSVDPLTKEYPWYTPYQFAGNMPVTYIDLDGLEPVLPDHIDPNKKILGNLTYQDLFNIVNDMYIQVMTENYIVEDGNGGHRFHQEKWIAENAPNITVGDLKAGESGALKANEQYKQAKISAERTIQNPKYSMFFEKKTPYKYKPQKKAESKPREPRVIGNLWPVAIIYVADAGGGVALTGSGEAGFITFIQGVDYGKTKTYADAGAGPGLSSPSINGKIALMFTNGDISRFTAEDAGGMRTEYNGGLAVGFELGLSGTRGDYNPNIKGRTWTVAIKGGLGAPTVGEADVNYGGAVIGE